MRINSKNPGIGIQTANLWCTSLTCYQLSCPDLKNYSKVNLANEARISFIQFVLFKSFQKCLRQSILKWDGFFLRLAPIGADINTMLCPIKVIINTTQLTVHTSCYCVLDLLCVNKISLVTQPLYSNHLNTEHLNTRFI